MREIGQAQPAKAEGPLPLPPPTPRRTEDIAIELAASYAQRIEAGDEEACQLQVLLNKLIEKDLANVLARRQREEEARQANLAEAKAKEAEAEARRVELKRKGGELPARSGEEME